MASGTTRGKRRLGRYLRSLLERSGLKPEEVATRAYCSPPTMFRILAGGGLPNSHQKLALILEVVGATEEERDKAFELYQVADVDTAVIEHAGELTPKYLRFRMDEAEAIKERSLDTVIVSGLLQVPE